MITTLLQIAAAIGIGVLISQAAKVAERKYRAKQNTHLQAVWDAHVEQAMKASQTPLYERIAHEFAKNIDEEWEARQRTGKWGTA